MFLLCCRKRALELLFKERFVTASNLQCKITGALNTRTGALPSCVPCYSFPVSWLRLLTDACRVH